MSAGVTNNEGDLTAIKREEKKMKRERERENKQKKKKQYVVFLIPAVSCDRVEF